MDQNKIGKFIAVRRKEQDMTQMQFAEKLGVTNKAVSKWETGKCLPDAALFEDICILLQISLSELFAGEKTAPAYNEKKTEESLTSFASEVQKKDYRITFLKYFTLGITLITLSVNISVGGIHFEGNPVLSNLLLTIVMLASWGTLSYFTQKELLMQKLAYVANAILFMSSIAAFALLFWDADSQIVLWIGF
ncbi:XRE family transcriptional regulator [Lactonifactor longoviformis]|uniref:Transcriptional regulator, contains XRE-family HTH domain n=1 Tax=Lactonifactor longoviformis DSM 17459 TaxID=1122155 RepID=A0A1M4XQ80_9CLOT|nr:helix-turn-helix transcriptional regulator [Lactonifactor longoviformis]POP30370.1 XRE family transcriptional regulator [Lactonifactor longoviformis]SHE95581.1 Transcriptional regulator, contains XRE-family HTH domain [Lactonifactor longoviformis DSM 17459]